MYLQWLDAKIQLLRFLDVFTKVGYKNTIVEIWQSNGSKFASTAASPPTSSSSPSSALPPGRFWWPRRWPRSAPRRSFIVHSFVRFSATSPAVASSAASAASAASTASHVSITWPGSHPRRRNASTAALLGPGRGNKASLWSATRCVLSTLNMDRRMVQQASFSVPFCTCTFLRFYISDVFLGLPNDQIWYYPST